MPHWTQCGKLTRQWITSRSDLNGLMKIVAAHFLNVVINNRYGHGGNFVKFLFNPQLQTQSTANNFQFPGDRKRFRLKKENDWSFTNFWINIQSQIMVKRWKIPSLWLCINLFVTFFAGNWKISKTFSSSPWESYVWLEKAWGNWSFMNSLDVFKMNGSILMKIALDIIFINPSCKTNFARVKSSMSKDAVFMRILWRNFMKYEWKKQKISNENLTWNSLLLTHDSSHRQIA